MVTRYQTIIHANVQCTTKGLLAKQNDFREMFYQFVATNTQMLKIGQQSDLIL
jgi:hypothetical protein